METSSKPEEWLQNKRYSLMAELSLPSTFFLNEFWNSQVFTHFNLKINFSFAIIESIAATLLKFINIFIKRETLAQVLSCEFCEISKYNFFTEHLWKTASFSLEDKPKISVREFAFHYAINSCVYLKRP